MNNFDEMLQELKDLNLTQKSYEWQEDLPNEIWEKYFKGNSSIKYGLDVDTHRWYETSTQVFRFGDRFLGVNSITNIFSEMSSPEDMYIDITFFEMKEVKTVTYESI